MGEPASRLGLLVKEPTSFSGPSKWMRAREIVSGAINDGKPLPLQVMLEEMWFLRDERIRCLERDDRMGAVAMAEKTMAAASKVAPYVHPRLSNERVDSGMNEDEGRANSAWAVMKALRGRSDADVARAYQSIVKGETLDGVLIEGNE